MKVLMVSLFCGTKFVTFAQPFVGAGVGRHSPVASWRQRATSHLRSIGKAATFELLGEEATEESAEPLCDGFGSIGNRLAAVECLTGEMENFRRPETIAQGVIEEEIVEFVGTYEIFGDLRDVSVLVCGKQFGTDGGVDDVKQGCCTNLVVFENLLRPMPD